MRLWGIGVRPGERREALGMVLAAEGELVHLTAGMAVPRTVEDGLSPQPAFVSLAEGELCVLGERYSAGSAKLCELCELCVSLFPGVNAPRLALLYPGFGVFRLND